jgi:hypothetical protein
MTEAGSPLPVEPFVIHFEDEVLEDLRGLGYERYGAGGGDFGAGVATVTDQEGNAQHWRPPWRCVLLTWWTSS